MPRYSKSGERVRALYHTSPIDASLLSERVYAALREEIFRQTLQPGTRLDVRDIATAYDTSVAPVRHALARLHEEGLVEISPRRGTFVSEIGPQDVREIFQIRRMIEVSAVDALQGRLPDDSAARLSAVVAEIEALVDGDGFHDYQVYIRLDEEFHRVPLAALGNRRLLRLFDGLHSHMHVARGLYPVANKRAPATIAEHRAILMAYQRNDPQGTKQAILTHLENAEADLLWRLASGRASAEATIRTVPNSRVTQEAT